MPVLTRLTSADVYRGFVMLLMMAEVLHFGEVSEALPESTFWSFLAFHQDHVEWVGCSLHDMIQPSFSFLVGVVLPYSIASRLTQESSFSKVLFHAFKRSLILILLGIFLRSQYIKLKPISLLKTPLVKLVWATQSCFYSVFVRRKFKFQHLSLFWWVIGWLLLFIRCPMPILIMRV